VLYIAGSGRSGSTLLAQILDQVEGVVGTGELRYLWERGLLQDQRCGCGRRLSSCSVWNSILVEAFGGPGGVDVDAAVAHQGRPTRVRRLPGLLWAARRRRPMPRLAAAHTERLERLYRAIPAVTGATVVVDSSKLPSYGQVLSEVDGVDLRVLHLVRDPQAAAFSWTRKKPLGDGGGAAVMASQGMVRSAGLWMIWNATSEVLWGASRGRYLRLRYEDFVADPRGSVEAVLALVDLGQGRVLDTVFVGDDKVSLEVTHSVAGNPGRMNHGVVAVSLDDEWVTAMAWWQKAVVTALTWPLLLRYGYPLVPGRRHRRERA